MRIRVNIPKPTSEGSQMPVSAAPAPRDLMHLLAPANFIQKGRSGIRSRAAVTPNAAKHRVRTCIYF